jgi:hypothetical protein
MNDRPLTSNLPAPPEFTPYDSTPLPRHKSAPPRGRATTPPSKRKIIKASRKQNRRKK